MKAILFFFLICISVNALAQQQAVVSCDAMRVVYAGLENPISVAVPGVKSKDLIVVPVNGTLIGENGKYVFKPIDNVQTREAYLKIFVKKGKDSIKAGVFAFRIKRVPRPTLYFGTKNGGNISKVELSAQVALFANLDNFVYEGIKYTVTSFDISLFSPKMHLTHCNKGQIPDNISRQIIENSNAWDLIVFSRVYVNGPIGRIMLGPLTFAIDDGFVDNGSAEPDPYDRLHYDDMDPQIPVEWNSLYRSYGTKYWYEGGFTDCKKDSIWTTTITENGKKRLLSIDYFHLDTVLKTENFYDTGKISSVFDFSMHTFRSFYLNGNTKSMGTFDNLMSCSLEERKKPEELKIAYRDSIQDYYFKDSLEIPLSPVKEWRFYYSNGQLMAKGNFKSMEEIRDYGGYRINLGNSNPDIRVRDGLWQFYNQKGTLLREMTYDRGKSIKIKKYQ